ncbi:MAG: hypothetical protein WC334_02205, partial [Kiritimatiellales bacterium]
DKLRKPKSLPQPFVRDILSYLRYTSPQISEHLNAVAQADYTSGDVVKPTVHFICLTPADGSGGAETDRNLRKLTADYGGSLILFKGAGSTDEINALNRNLGLAGQPDK